jgi:RES domain-containing protein
MVYATDAPATALLETLVHTERANLLTAPYVVFTLHLDDERHLLRLPAEMLPADWQAWPWPASTQEIGTYWFQARASLMLEVPCAVVPHHRNYLINPRHPAFAELRIEGPRPFPMDARLGVSSPAVL